MKKNIINEKNYIENVKEILKNQWDVLIKANKARETDSSRDPKTQTINGIYLIV
jgi:hypothetical protein